LVEINLFVPSKHLKAMECYYIGYVENFGTIGWDYLFLIHEHGITPLGRIKTTSCSLIFFQFLDPFAVTTTLKGFLILTIWSHET
jgi:hypothetical protein